MVWVAVLGLTIWLIVQQSNLGDLKRELAQLRQLLADRAKPPPAAATGITPAMEAAARRAADAAPVPTISAPAMPPPVVTAPPAVEPAVAPLPEPAAAAGEVTQFAPPAPALIRPRLPPAPALTRAAVERWLAENGLAWIGGSALVIGGAFLVGYAAQRGLFTPQMRIIAAAVLGLVLIGAGELIRRRKLANFGENPLASAIVTGAGAAVLYATTWAAFDLYGFITGAMCGGLLALIAWSLLGLAFLHGEALAVLAIGGAFVAPMVSGADAWSTEALSLYLGILIIAGVVVGWLRAWPATLWTTLVGAALWAVLGAAQDQSLKALLLGLEPPAVLAVLAFIQPRNARGAVGLGAVIVASLATFAALPPSYAHGGLNLEGVIAALALPALAAALQRRGQIGRAHV